MRKAVIIGFAAALAAVALGFSALTQKDARPARPTLRVLHTATLTVRGTHFRSGERVRLRAGHATLRTKASGDGVFVVTIRGATRCDATRVLARGSAGSYAIVKVLPSPACAPARSGG